MTGNLESAIREAAAAGLEVDIRADGELFAVDIMVPEFGPDGEYAGAGCFQSWVKEPFDNLVNAILEAVAEFRTEKR